MSGAALLLATLLALPVGVILGHTGKASLAVISIANIGRALPSLAILTLSLPLAFMFGMGLGFWPTVITLIPLGIPLILINSYAAVRAVDPEVIEAARGLGLRGWQILRDVELPLGAGLIIGGVRNAAVNIIATATLGAWVASGGLGRYITDGFARQEYERMIVGAILVALLAIGAEVGFGLLSRALVPAVIRPARRT
jgi:osmoprotectant transport system permease protein